MKINTYLFIIAAVALLSATACNETEPASGNSQAIRFAGPLQTKAYTDAADHSDIFEVRDIYNGSTLLIENTLVYSGSAWEYGTGAQDQYNWKNGTHNLFGWLQTDGNYNTATEFGTLTLSGTTLTIPAKTLTNASHQYDFLYSQSVQRNTSENDYSEVPLIFKHLFAQVAISFKIDDEYDEDANGKPKIVAAYLNSNFHNAKSATIDFSSEGNPAVNFTPETSSGLFAPASTSLNNNGDGTVYEKSSTPFDLLAQTQSATKTFYYVWPMTSDELIHATTTDRVITIDYFYPNDNSGSSYSSRSSKMSFPAGTSWEAGNKYSYTITYMGGILKVTETVLPWDYESTTGLDASTQSAMASWVGWDVSTADETGLTAKFKSNGSGGYIPMHGIFRINSPTSCTYSIALTGTNASSFSITSGASGTIGTGDGQIDPGDNIDFYITPTGSAAVGHTANLTFTVTVGGRTMSIDSEVQRDGTFIIEIPSA